MQNIGIFSNIVSNSLMPNRIDRQGLDEQVIPRKNVKQVKEWISRLLVDRHCVPEELRGNRGIKRGMSKKKRIKKSLFPLGEELDWLEYCWQFELEIMVGWASLVGQMLKNSPEMQETQVRSLGQEEHLEKEMATHVSVLAWRIPWTEEPGGLPFHGVTESCTWLSK